LSDTGFDLNGFSDLQENLQKAIKKYPDMGAERLENISKDFKKRVIQITKQSVDSHTGKLIRGFKLDKMRGFGVNMEKDYRGTAPHFHLIENGHNQVTKDGRNVGWVPGRLIVKQARDEYADKMPQEMQKLIEDITRECDLN
jgi:hypothetical protein